MKNQFPCATKYAAPANSSASILSISPTKASSSPSSPPEFADIALNAIQLTDGGDQARIIGQIRNEPANTVVVNTRYGGTRIVDMLVGDPLPRIC